MNSNRSELPSPTLCSHTQHRDHCECHTGSPVNSPRSRSPSDDVLFTQDQVQSAPVSSSFSTLPPSFSAGQVRLQDDYDHSAVATSCSSTAITVTAATPTTATIATTVIPSTLSCEPRMECAHNRTATSHLTLLDLPTEILQEIVCRLVAPRSFVRCCRQIYMLAKSASLRAKYLWLLHGPDRVLTRKTVELHKLTVSILNSPVVVLLMAMGASCRDAEEFIFRWACSKGHVDVVYQLLLSEPRIDLRFRSDWFLREAAKSGHQDIISVLLQQHDYVPSDSGLNKAFEGAYEQSFCSTVKALFDYAEAKGASLENDSNSFHTVEPCTRRARRVKAGGLDIQKDADKALRYAVRGNDLEMVKLLLEYQADVHAFNEEAIVVAAQKGHIEVLKLLIQAGADIETKAGAPLRRAAECGHAEAVRILCESGADTMWGGCSALRTAASQGSDTIIATLLNHGANVNIHEGTPLQLACQHGHEAAVRILLQYGANHRLDDGAAYKLAIEANHEGVKALLIQAETTMRAKEREFNRILQAQRLSWNLSHTLTYSETSSAGASYATASSTLPSSPSAMSGGMVNGAGGFFGGASVGMDSMARGHKRFYSQMASPLSVADLFRSGSICGLVALDDEIRSRQRSESNRL